VETVKLEKDELSQHRMQQGVSDSTMIQESQSTRRDLEAAYCEGGTYSLPAYPDLVGIDAVQLLETELDL
jgi:hypothetical protein